MAKNDQNIGGLAELTTLINKEKEKLNNKCIVTLNGDFLSGSLMATKCKGKNMIDVLNDVPSKFYYI